MHNKRAAHILPFAALTLALLASPGVFAADTVVIGEPRNPTDEAVIRALEDEGRRAVLNLDFATLERLWSEHFVVNSPGNFVLPNRAAVFELFRRSANGLYSSYEKKIEWIAFDGDLAIVMGSETVVPLATPMAGRAVHRRYTNVWRVDHGAWRLIARQATMISSPQPPAGASG